MANELGTSDAARQRTRRNLVKMGVILGGAAATFATTRAAVAGGQNGQGQNGQGQNGQGQNGQGQNRGDPKCFLRGTTIETTEGRRKVESLNAGDFLPTMFGGVRPIQWIGRYSIKKSNPSKPWPKDARPVRIARSAVAPDVPRADLYVTDWHALFVDGVLVPAGLLINGATIARCDLVGCDELEFFHIKLETHDVIYAEGAPVETLLRVDESAVNFADYFRRYGMAKTEDVPCASYVSYGGRGELKSRMRSAISPLLDRRTHGDVVRDRLEERGVVIARQSELAD